MEEIVNNIFKLFQNFLTKTRSSGWYGKDCSLLGRIHAAHVPYRWVLGPYWPTELHDT